jgi:putative membrane protein
VATKGSLQQSMDNAVKRYSSLFRLPSIQTAISLLAFSCGAAGLLSTLALWQSLSGTAFGIVLAIVIFSVVVGTDYITNAAVFKRKTIFNLRRALVLSLFSWGIWLLFIAIGSLLSVGLSSQGWWIRLCLLGYSAATISRMVIFSSTIALKYSKIIFAAFLQPLVTLAILLAFWLQTGHMITFQIVAFIFFSIAATLISSFVFLHLLDRLGKKTLGVGSLSLFRAFMLNWVLSLNAPFEQILENLGEKKDVETCFAKFASHSTQIVMAVPSVHPGPFKNIGSSLLPSLVKTALEKQPNCVACVPHGLMGHEFDLASQEQNQKIINQLVTSVNAAEVSETKASPFVKVTDGLATACGQVFGKSVLVSFTLAPKTIEDLPPELGVFVSEEARKNGLDLCAAVDAHNSMNGEAEIEKSMDSLKNVASKCLAQVASLRQSAFEVGASTIAPREFRLEDGMGAGGITVVIVKCGSQKAAYVVIDGNNMVSGLREEILSSLNSLGIDDGEVFTTDTHAVSALILGKQGYHLVGEVIDKSVLLSYIKTAALTAISKLQPAKVVSGRVSVKEVTVLGAKPLQTLCLLIDECLRTAKKSVVPVFLTAGLLLMIFLLFV